jgi:DNA-binding LacI/PurR family transcriptional regulator
LSSSKTSLGGGGDVLILVHDKLTIKSSWTQMVLFNVMRILGDYGYRSRIEFRSKENTKISTPLRSANACIVWGDFKKELYSTIATKCRNIPIVSYSYEIPYDNSISIFSKDKHSMSQLVSHLLAARHNKIGLIGYKGLKTKERYMGFVETMDSFGCKINDSWIISETGKELSAPGYDTTIKLLKNEDCPSAIIYGSDQLAIGGIEAIKQSGYKIPEDISVVSFDDLPESATTFPPLTTMKLDTISLATLIVESLEKLLLGRLHENKIFIERQLIQRQSVALRK